MTDQLPEQERLRIERSEFLIALGALTQGDPRRQPLNRKLIPQRLRSGCKSKLSIKPQ